MSEKLSESLYKHEREIWNRSSLHTPQPVRANHTKFWSLNALLIPDFIQHFRTTFTEAHSVVLSSYPLSFDRIAYAKSSLKERLAPQSSSQRVGSCASKTPPTEDTILTESHITSKLCSDRYNEMSVNRVLAAESLIEMSGEIQGRKPWLNQDTLIVPLTATSFDGTYHTREGRTAFNRRSAIQYEAPIFVNLTDRTKNMPRNFRHFLWLVIPSHCVVCSVEYHPLSLTRCDY